MHYKKEVHVVFGLFMSGSDEEKKNDYFKPKRL